ncbi:MAG: isoprenylcysteine carboxylmethyltransferase family protein [Candidatus Thorarchaeota archaeon]|nr:isoprenylcysteine carboxylmethyltransferase family protein [Candidatus Thorarchaeota archaeon]
MSFWFFLSFLGVIAVVPIHFVSVSHARLVEKYGEERGTRIGVILGMISGWGIFLFLFGLWVSPQARFVIPLMQETQFIIPIFGFLTLQIPVLHLILSLVFIAPGAWLGIRGVSEIGLKASETHRPARIITTGIYSHIRHPQYLGAMLSHIGITLIVSGFYSLLVTPIVILINWLLCWKEEKELVREFGNDYREYQKAVPMFFPHRN